jgi:hypothetical protein
MSENNKIPPPSAPPNNDNNSSDLMKENEALKKQVADLQQILEVKNQKIIKQVSKIVGLTFFKSSFQSRKRVREFFDRWSNNVKVELTIMNYHHKEMKYVH